MKFIVVLTLLLGFATFLWAQTYSEAEMTKSLIENEKETIITEAMDFSETESQAFWPLYKDYKVELEEVFNRKVNLLYNYADNYGHITDENAIEMINELLDIQDKENKIRKAYLKRYLKILPARKVARFYQLENKMAAVINYDLAEIIPRVE